MGLDDVVEKKCVSFETKQEYVIKKKEDPSQHGLSAFYKADLARKTRITTLLDEDTRDEAFGLFVIVQQEEHDYNYAIPVVNFNTGVKFMSLNLVLKGLEAIKNPEKRANYILHAFLHGVKEAGCLYHVEQEGDIQHFAAMSLFETTTDATLAFKKKTSNKALFVFRKGNVFDFEVSVPEHIFQENARPQIKFASLTIRRFDGVSHLFTFNKLFTFYPQSLKPTIKFTFNQHHQKCDVVVFDRKDALEPGYTDCIMLSCGEALERLTFVSTSSILKIDNGVITSLDLCQNNKHNDLIVGRTLSLNAEAQFTVAFGTNFPVSMRFLHFLSETQLTYLYSIKVVDTKDPKKQLKTVKSELRPENIFEILKRDALLREGVKFCEFSYEGSQHEKTSLSQKIICFSFSRFICKPTMVTKTLLPQAKFPTKTQKVCIVFFDITLPIPQSTCSKAHMFLLHIMLNAFDVVYTNIADKDGTTKRSFCKPRLCSCLYNKEKPTTICVLVEKDAVVLTVVDNSLHAALRAENVFKGLEFEKAINTVKMALNVQINIPKHERSDKKQAFFASSMFSNNEFTGALPSRSQRTTMLKNNVVIDFLA